MAEKQRNAPYPRQSHYGKNDPADDRRLAAENPAYDIELKQSDRAPVQRSDNHKDQSYSVQHTYHSFCSLLFFTVCSFLF